MINQELIEIHKGLKKQRIERKKLEKKQATLKKLQKKTFKFHSDAGHGWLAVKLKDIHALGIKYISPYSYIEGQTIYLEEDCDMGMFVKIFTETFGHKPNIKALEPKDRSHIRSMEIVTLFNLFSDSGK